jgi:O-antigen/teichoic acid export membrane protein
MGFALIAVGVASPFVLSLWLVRRGCYVNYQPRLAAGGGALYLLLSILGLWGLKSTGLLTPTTAFIMMGLFSAAVAILLRLRLMDTTVTQELTTVFADHWSYGRWSLVAATLSWIPSNLYYVVLPGWGGLEGSAGVKALSNLVMPILQFNAALTLLLVPAFVRARDTARLRRKVLFALALLCTSSAFYWILLGLFGPEVSHWLYDGKYDDFASWLWIIGALPLTAAVVAVLGSVIRALERPRWVAGVYGGVALYTVSVGLLVVALFGVLGAIIGLLCSSLLTALGLLMFWFTGRRDNANRARRHLQTS